MPAAARPPPATAAGLAALRARVVQVRGHVLDGCADGRLAGPICMCQKARLDYADTLADIAAADIAGGEVGRARGRLRVATEIIGDTRHVLAGGRPAPAAALGAGLLLASWPGE